MNKSRSTIYVESLVNFVLDTKPYHSKLTEVQVEYRFSDELKVRLTENSFIDVLQKAAWNYNYFSDGNSALRSFRALRPGIPEFLSTAFNSRAAGHRGAFLVGADELTDLTGVPLVFDTRAYDGPGINGVRLCRSPSVEYPLCQGHDWHEVKGSFEFKTSLTNTYTTGFFEATYPADHPGGFPFVVPISVGAASRLLIAGPAEQVTTSSILVTAPGRVQVWGLAGSGQLLWQDTRLLDQVAQARAETRARALDTSNPGSANRQLHARLTDIRNLLVVQGATLTGAALAARNLAIDRCDALLDILDVPYLPASFEDLLSAAVASTISPASLGFTGWVGEDGTPLPADRYVDEALQRLVPPLFFAQTDGDLSLRRSGTLAYSDVDHPALVVTNISTNQTVFDRWTLRCVQTTPAVLWIVEGDYYGVAGGFQTGTSFSSGFLSFDTAPGTGTATVGDTVVLEPNRSIVLDSTRPAETWNIIRTNPLVASRPTFVSGTVGTILSASLEVGRVTINSASIASGELILVARPGGLFFDATYTAMPSYSAVVPVGVPFSDSQFSFTLQPGTGGAFNEGDTFIVHIVNEPARADELGLFYSYDVDPYDNPDLVYNNTNPAGPNYGVKLNFSFDSRFPDYDFNTIGLQVSPGAQDGKRYRFRALPNGAPIATLKQDNVTISHAVDLVAGSAEYDYTLNSSIFPTGVVPIFSLPGGTDPSDADIYLYLSTSFAVEEYDELSSTWLPVGGTPGVPGVSQIDVGVAYSHGDLSFTIQPGARPFIGAISDAGMTVEGGDVFSFVVRNPAPYQDPVPAILASGHTPWLELQTGGMWRAPAAKWRVEFTSSTSYTVTGTYTEGAVAGSPVTGYPRSGTLSLPAAGPTEGATFKTTELHLTIKSGSFTFSPGDYFEFETYSRKPSLLVHGTVSGWQPEAVIGEWYWNGRIGFKIDPPQVTAFIEGGSGPSPFDGPEVDVSWVRPDLSDVTYLLKNTGPGKWMVHRSDRGIVGVCAPTFDDGDIALAIDPDFNTDIWIDIRAAEPFRFWKAPSTIVNRSIISFFQGQAGDYLVPAKAHHAGIALSLNYSALDGPAPSISSLSPVSINPAIIDLYPGPGSPPISVTSPETAILGAWLPLVIEGRDSATSVAEWPDAANELRLRSAASNLPVGRLYRENLPGLPWKFEWDLDFFNTYVPLNTEANLTVFGTGLNEKVKVNMTDVATFLLGGPMVGLESLFDENLGVSIIDTTVLQARLGRYLGEGHPLNIDWNPDSISVALSDTFDGFLPGYSNLPFDSEDATGLSMSAIMAANGAFDTGRPLVDAFVRAVYLFHLSTRTAAEEAELATLTALVQAYLQPGGIGSTTVQQFIAAFEADTFGEGGTGPSFGIPRRGLGIDVLVRGGQAPSPEAAPTSFVDFSLSRAVTDGNPYDVYPYDSERFDELADSTCFYTIKLSGPIEVPSPPVSFPHPYSDVESPLENRQEVLQLSAVVSVEVQPARVFSVQLLNLAGAPLQLGSTWVGTVPTFRFMEFASSDAPVQPVIYRGDSIFEFSLSNPMVGKVIIE